MQTNRYWYLKWFDVITVLTVILLLVLLFFINITAGIAISVLSIPFIIILKYKTADKAWRELANSITLPSENSEITFVAGKTVRSESYLQVNLSMKVPHTYSEFRGGDSVQRLTSQNFPEALRTPLNGIYQEVSRHVFYCRQEDKIEALSLYTPEVLQQITAHKVRCAIETRSTVLKIYSHPSSFVDASELKLLQSLLLNIQKEINERVSVFNRDNKQFEYMDVKRAKGYLSNLTDQAKIMIMATSTIAVLSLIYATDAGSGDIVSPALDLPEWIGLALAGFVLTSPLLIIIVVFNLQRLTASVRKPIKTLNIGSTYLSRGVVFYIILLLVVFILLMFASTDTAR